MKLELVQGSLPQWMPKKIGLLLVTRDEALSLIRSLSEQMLNKSPNSGRIDFTLDDGMSFSVAVTSEFDSTKAMDEAFQRFIGDTKE